MHPLHHEDGHLNLEAAEDQTLEKEVKRKLFKYGGNNEIKLNGHQLIKQLVTFKRK